MRDAVVGERRAQDNLPVLVGTRRNVGRRHLQLALDLGDVVVRDVRAALERVGKRVRALALLRLSAGVGVCRAVLADESLAADFDLVLDERRAVVGLLVALRRDRHRTPRHLERTRIPRERVVGRDVDLATHHLDGGDRVLNDAILVLTVNRRRHDALLRERHFEPVTADERPEVRRLVLVELVLLPIVDPGPVLRRDGDFRRALLHGQRRTRRHRDVVVGHQRGAVRNRERRRSLPCLGDGCEVREGEDLNARHRRFVRIRAQILVAYLRRRKRQRRAVIRLRLGRCGERDRALRHPDGSRLRLDLVVLRLGVAVQLVGECVLDRLRGVGDVQDFREALVGRALARDETVTRHFDDVCDVGRAVVHPLRSTTRQLEVARQDRPVLLDRAGVVPLAGDLHLVVARIRRGVARERIGNVVEVAVRLHVADLDDRRGLHLAVVHRRLVEPDVPVRRIVADRPRLDLQLAELGLRIIVPRKRPLGERPREGVVLLPDIRNRREARLIDLNPLARREWGSGLLTAC